MFVGDLEIVVDRHRVELRAGERVVATGRWTGRGVDDRTGADDAVWDAVAERIARDEADALASAESTAHDQEGVDLTLIDWMLTLTPTERLRVLERHAAGLAPFVHDDPHAVVLQVGEHAVRVLGLERLIEVKERAGRPKDLAVLPVLRATLARVRQ